MAKHEALDLAFSSAKKWLDGLDDRPANATAGLETLRSRLGLPLNERGIPASEVIDHLARSCEDGLLGSAGGKFFAWVISGSLPSALAADWLTSTWDQNAALYACGPAAAVVEEVAGEWIKELLGLPREASFAFTTGCQLAHFTCLAAARAAVLSRAGWDINTDGLFGAPKIRVLVTDQNHGSIDRAVRYLGLGNRSMELIPTDSDGRVTVESLEKILGLSRAPSILVLDAADLNIAAFDPFEQLIPVAKKAGAWVHIDGAFGLFARASKNKKHLTQGVDLADSWATDAHKWLNVPFDSGIAIIRDRKAHRESMTISASYIAAEKSARDQIDWNPEWSRRARGFPIYAALRELGKEGVESLVDRCSLHCHALVTGIASLPGAEMLWEPQLNQGLVRFRGTGVHATEQDHDAQTDSVIAAVNESGDAFFSGTTWKGKRAMRVSVVNWRTNENDVQRTIDRFKVVLDKI